MDTDILMALLVAAIVGPILGFFLWHEDEYADMTDEEREAYDINRQW